MGPANHLRRSSDSVISRDASGSFVANPTARPDGHSRKPSLDRLRAKMGALNCYSAHANLDEGSTEEHDREDGRRRSLPRTPPPVRERTPSVGGAARPRGNVPYLGGPENGDPADAGDQSGWRAVDPSRFSVRGPTYLADHKKAPSAGALFEAVAVDNFSSGAAEEDFAVRPGCAAHELLRQRADTELLILNIQLPGPPNLTLLHVFERVRPKGGGGQAGEGSEPAARLWDAFCAQAADFRSRRLKILANLVGAPLAVRTAMPSRPAILGTRVPLRWHQRERSLEIVLDVAFSAVAAPVWRLMRSATTKVVLDLALIVEGTTEEQLPEQVLMAMQWHKPDFSSSSPPPCPPAPPGEGPPSETTPRPKSSPGRWPS